MENIILSSADSYLLIPRGDLEVHLPPALYNLFTQSDRVTSGYSIYVLNGPGSFTNLRIGCLCVNMLKELMELQDKQISIYTLDKNSLYQKLYQRDLIPTEGAMYIGQRKNFWICDLAQDRIELRHTEGNNFPALFEGKNYRSDSNSDQTMTSDPHCIDLRSQGDTLQVGFDGKATLIPLSELEFENVDKLVPNYILEPNITI